MAYKFQLGAYTASGTLKQEGTLECETSLTIGSAALTEAELEKLDGITNGTAAANKALVLDGDKDIGGIRELSASVLSASQGHFDDITVLASSITIGSTTLSEGELGLLDGAADHAVSMGADSVVFYDAGTSKFRYDAISDFASGLAGAGLGASSGVLAVANASNGGLSVNANDINLDFGDLSEVAIDVANDYIAFADATDGETRREAVADLVSATAGAGLAATNGVLAVVNATNGGLDVQANDIKLDIGNLTAGTADYSNDLLAFWDVSATQTKKITWSNFVASIAGDGLINSSGRMVAQLSGALAIKSDSIVLSSSAAGTGLEVSAEDLASGIVSAINIDMTNLSALGGTGLHQSQDHFMFSDNGTIKKITFSNLEDAIFGNVSGDATIAAGGALTIANDAVESGMLNDNVISGQSALGSAGVAQADELLFSDGGTLKKVTFSNFEDSIFGNVSGDIAVAAGGAATIQANAVEGSMLNNNVISGLTDIGGALATDDELMVSDGGTLRRMDLSRLSTMMQSTGLADSSGQLSVAAAQTSITSIINSSLGKIGTAADQEYIDFGTSNEIKFVVNDSAVASVEAGVFVVAGDLRVNGTTTTINSTSVNVSASFTFEGPADAHETTLHAGGDGTGASPQADTNLYLPALTAGNYYIPALADQASQASAAVTAAEFALLDGGSTVGTTALASGDGFLHNDGGTMKQTSVDKIADLFAGDGLAASSGVMALSIAGLSSELSSATLADTDEFAISDGGSMKKIDFQYVRDSVFADVSGDATVAAGGALTIANDAVESGMLNDNIISGQSELASGGVVDADEMMISDGGTLKKVGVDSLKVYMQAATIQLIDDSGTAIVGFNYFGAHGGAESCTLPASPAVGDVVYIKAGSDCSSSNKVTINKAGSQTIDGEIAIILESPYAAVNICYVAADTWRVF